MSLDLEKHGYTPSVFHVLFPIFGVAYHTQLKTVHNKKQHLIFHIVQIAVFVGFLGVILATWAGLDLLIATGTSLILVPIVSIIYSYTIFHMKCMATGRMANNAQDGENEGPNNRQRLADAADLDERQEVAIREFQERHQNVQVNFDRQNFGGGLVEAGQELVDFEGDPRQQNLPNNNLQQNESYEASADAAPQ